MSRRAGNGENPGPPALVITGASSGIGHATVKLAVAQGWRVFGSVRKAADADGLKDEFGHRRRARRTCQRGRPVALPARDPHSIQGLDSDVDGCEFPLVFDDGNFSEDSTFLLTDWLAQRPATCWPRTSRRRKRGWRHCHRRSFTSFQRPNRVLSPKTRAAARDRCRRHSVTAYCSKRPTERLEAPSASRIPRYLPHQNDRRSRA
jgi:hypothetical protein